MPKRISIAGLMGFVVVIAIGLFALKHADRIWASGCYTLTIFALMNGLFQAAFGRGRSRAFWAGFSLAGSLYLLIVYRLVSHTEEGSPPRLLTEYGIIKLQEIMQGTVIIAEAAVSFEQIGQCLWTFFIAYTGGHYANYLVARRKGADASAPPWISPSSP